MGVEPQGNTRAVLWRLDRFGALRGQSSDLFQTAGGDALEALAVSVTGAVHAVGRTRGAFPGPSSAGKADAFVAWADAAAPGGAWTVAQFGIERPLPPRRAAFQPGGALVVAGDDDECVPTNHVEAWTDPFATALVPRRGAGGAGDAGIAWHRPFATPEPDLVDGLAIAADGVSTFVSGRFGGDVKGMFVRRLDARGQAVGTARCSRVALDHIAAIAPLPDGTLWIGGSDRFLLRVTPQGRLLGARQWGGEGDGAAVRLAVDACGNVVAVGSTVRDGFRRARLWFWPAAGR